MAHLVEMLRPFRFIELKVENVQYAKERKPTLFVCLVEELYNIRHFLQSEYKKTAIIFFIKNETSQLDQIKAIFTLHSHYHIDDVDGLIVRKRDLGEGGLWARHGAAVDLALNRWLEQLVSLGLPQLNELHQ